MSILIILVVLLNLWCIVSTDVSPSDVLSLMKKQGLRTAKGNVDSYPAETHEAPITGLNTWKTSKAGSWTSGFFPGFLWQLFNVTQDSQFKTLAMHWTEGIRSQENNTGTHDVGFMVFDSFGKGLELGNVSDYKAVVLQTAASLSTRFNSKVGCTMSWNPGHHCRLHKQYKTNFPVIIDNMMNLELLLWAANNGGPKIYQDMAISHAKQTSKNHVRDDGSTFHVVNYDPDSGKADMGCTAQGYMDNSTWSRGQAWCIYGFTMVYRYTKDDSMLDTAKKCADFFLKSSTLPSDMVPLWDFSWDGSTDLGHRDSSAGAIVAAALAELGEYATGGYKEAALQIVKSLTSSTYLGNYTDTEGVVIHATTTGNYNQENSNVDVSLPYGDYFLLQAMRTLRLV